MVIDNIAPDDFKGHLQSIRTRLIDMKELLDSESERIDALYNEQVKSGKTNWGVLISGAVFIIMLIGALWGLAIWPIQHDLSRFELRQEASNDRLQGVERQLESIVAILRRDVQGGKLPHVDWGREKK